MKERLNATNHESEFHNNLVLESNVDIVKKRMKRRISATEKIPQMLHIETAIFVDKDLYKHMATNFANDTESQIIRFVLALINGVSVTLLNWQR